MALSNRRPSGVPPGSLSPWNNYVAGSWQIYLASTTWRHPSPGTPLTIVQCSIGGGGGGGNGQAGGGGGSGRVLISTLTGVTTDQAIVIGSAGANGAPGSTGGTTTFGALVSLTGGLGGAGVGGGAVQGGAGGNGGFGGGGGGGFGAGPPAGGAGGSGLDYLGGGGGGASGTGQGGNPGSSINSCGFIPQKGFNWIAGIAGETIAFTQGGWPNGGYGDNEGGNSAGPGGGGSPALIFPQLFGRGAGGTGNIGSSSLAGAVALLIQPF